MHTHNENLSETQAENHSNCAKSAEREKSLFAELFGQDVYDQLLRERNLRLLDEPFGRAMMMAEFLEKEPR